MNPPRGIIRHGRPWLGGGLLVGAGFSIAVLLLEGSGAGGHTGVKTIPHFDKLLHFGAHLWVGSLMFWGLIMLGRPRRLGRRAAIACGIVLLVDGLSGIGVEWIQDALGSRYGRTPDALDVIANLLGTTCALILGVSVVIWRNRLYTGNDALSKPAA